MFFANLGDMHYSGSKETTNLDFQRAYHEIFKPDVSRAFYQSKPIVYTMDDHDTGANNSNGKSKSVMEANDAFRAIFPHYQIPPQKGFWQSFKVGGILFLVTDSRSYLYTENDDEGAADNKSETYFGRDQFR